MTDAPTTQILVDSAWWPLGDGKHEPATIAEALMGKLVPDLTGPEATALNANLVAVAEWARSLAPGQRRNFALVRDPRGGRVDALMSFRYSALAENVYAKYLELAQSQRSTDKVDLVNQQVEERTLPGGRVITVHDFVVDREGGVAKPARERVTVAFFSDHEPTLIELHIGTHDLTLFDNLVEYAVGMIAGDEVGVPGYLERQE